MLLILALLGVLLYGWFVSFGWRGLFQPVFLGSYYDALGESLLQGRFDVPYAAIGGEAIGVNGKVYGYFAFGPSLPRIILNRIWPQNSGRWSRLSVWVACTFQLLLAGCALACFGCRLWRPLPALFLLSLLAGSSLVYIASNAFIYHEAIAWGSAFALLSGWFCILAAAHPSHGKTLVAAVSALAALWCRVPTGVAALCACAVVAADLVRRSRQKCSLRHALKETQSPRQLKSQAAVLLAAVLIGICTYVAQNRIRFGSYLDGMPVRYMVNYAGERGERIGYQLFHPEFIPRLAWEHLSPLSAQINSTFPWFHFEDFNKKWFPPPRGFDSGEPYAGLLFYSPGLASLAVAGFIWGSTLLFPIPKVRRILAALALTLPVSFSFVFLTNRYHHDWFPFLALSGALGLAWLENGGLQRSCRAVKVAIGVLLLWSVPVSLALALQFQREISLGVDEEARAEFRQVQRTVDRAVAKLLGDGSGARR